MEKTDDDDKKIFVGDHEMKKKKPLMSVPQDKFKVIFWIMIIQGLGGLLPFNMFINAYEYFSYKFNGTNVSFSDSFESYFSITSMLPIIIGSAVIVWLQTRVSIKRRFIVATTGMLVIFTITTAFIKVPTKNWVRGFFPFTLLSLFCLNGFSSINQSSIIGLSGILGHSYVGAVMTGQAVAGIFTSVASIIAVSIGPISTGQCEPGNVEYSALGYFLSAVIVILICLVSFLVMIRMDFTRCNIEANSTSQQTQRSSNDVNTDEQTQPENETMDDELDDLLPSSRRERIRTRNGFRQIWEVFKKIWIHGIGVFMVFLVTLALFPTVLTNIQSVSYHSDKPEKHPWSDCLFVPLMCFLIFNVSDFVGRTVPQWIIWPKNRFALLGLSLCRVVLIPLMLLCNHKGSNRSNIVFKSDIFPILFNTILGLTNGYIATICMILAPQSVGSKKAETASTIMSFFLSSGLTAGAVLSFVMLAIMGVPIIS